ncbi:MAG: hypothetical protein LBN74_01455 [Prevotella sp.]|jgi:hypothetical protein|nr:hypothetical protein [Prevotella sp.]
MDSITLYARKAQLIQSILNDADEEMITKIAAILVRKDKSPAQMTVEELKEEVMQSVEDAKNGKGKPMEQLFKEAEQW